MVKNVYPKLSEMVRGGNCQRCKQPAQLSMWADTNGVICAKCWPDFKAEHFTEATCKNCRGSIVHRKEDAPPALCRACEEQRFICRTCRKERIERCPDRWGGECKLCRKKAAVHDFLHSVPICYQDTELDRIPDINAAHDSILWLGSRDHKPGAFLWGASGAGKTRTLYLMSLNAINSDRSASVIRGQQFARDIVERTRPGGSGDIEPFIRHLLEVDFLGIDEVDKLRFSDRVEAEFFFLLEERIARKKTMVFTSNARLAEFVFRFSETNREPVTRRLQEFFRPVRFENRPLEEEL